MKSLRMSLKAILITCLFLVSCEKTFLCINGEGVITTKTLDVSNFSGIALSEACNIVISQGATQEVTAIGHPNIIDRIKKRVTGDVWEIDFGKECYTDYELTIYITVPDISFIALSGSGDITVNDFANQSELSLNISGSGVIKLNAFDDAEYLTVNISGSGAVIGYQELLGLIKTDIKISGSGVFNGYPIKTDDCKIIISGSGNCYVYVREELDVIISGSGSVFYKGTPIVTSIISGSGSVINTNK